MFLGRILGTFIAVFLAVVFHNSDPVLEVALILLYTAIGTVVGILTSAFFGPNIDTNRPFPQDSEKYWVEKYGERLGKDAYKMWLEELDKL